MSTKYTKPYNLNLASESLTHELDFRSFEKQVQY